jgi:hypothetical protein
MQNFIIADIPAIKGCVNILNTYTHELGTHLSNQDLFYFIARIESTLLLLLSCSNQEQPYD